MKKLILACLLLSPFGANAVVADKLTCAFKIDRTNSKTGELETIGQAQSLYVIRQEVKNHPFPSDITVTEANASSGVSIKKDNYVFEWYYNVQYTHALKAGPNGLIAQQRNCLSATVRFCPEGTTERCMSSKMSCDRPDDPPFGPNPYWNNVAVISGVPVFDDKTPLGSSMSMEDKYGNQLILNMECQYKGTYQ